MMAECVEWICCQVKYNTCWISNLNVDIIREEDMIQRNENWKTAEKSTEQHQHKDYSIRKGRTREINEYHKTLGRSSEAITNATAYEESVSLKGNFNT